MPLGILSWNWVVFESETCHFFCYFIKPQRSSEKPPAVFRCPAVRGHWLGLFENRKRRL